MLTKEPSSPPSQFKPVVMEADERAKLPKKAHSEDERQPRPLNRFSNAPSPTIAVTSTGSDSMSEPSLVVKRPGVQVAAAAAAAEQDAAGEGSSS